MIQLILKGVRESWIPFFYYLVNLIPLEYFRENGYSSRNIPKMEEIFSNILLPISKIKVAVFLLEPPISKEMEEKEIKLLLNYFVPEKQHKAWEKEGRISLFKFLAEKGIAIFYSSPTVERGKSQSHTEIWEKFTEEFLKKLSRNVSIIFFFPGPNFTILRRNVVNGKVVEEIDEVLKFKERDIKVDYTNFIIPPTYKSNLLTLINCILQTQRKEPIEWQTVQEVRDIVQKDSMP